MKNTLILLLGLTTALLMADEKDVFSKIRLEEAFIEGKSQGKAVIVKFHADWCHNCRKMDRETFANSSIKMALENYIALKVDIETKEGLALAHAYGVKALPTILVFNENGKITYQQAGFQTAKQFRKVLNTIDE